MSTKENLQAAFAGESQANRKYTAFARKADAEGYPGVAGLFRAAAEAETVHALSHLRVMEGVGTTAENLQAAIEGETYEHTTMYPDFIAQAQAEGNDQAAMSFANANAVEKIHAEFYKKASADMGAGGVTYYVCQVCGNTVENEAPDTCPICGSARKFFKKID